MNKLIKIITSVFYVGFIPVMPGTAASLSALAVFYFSHQHKTFLFSLIITSAILGFAFCRRAEILFRKKDAKQIVIDEFFAMLAVLMFVRPTPFFLISAFIIFRIMDISKPWPIRKIEKCGGSAGIMLDDCLAGAYTVVAVKLIEIVTA